MTAYTYTASTDFINNLTFDYVETYSFQRGTEFEEQQKLIIPEYEILKNRKEKKNNLTLVEDERLLELHELLGFTQYLLNDKKQIHPSSKKINTYKFDSPIIDRLKNILRNEIVEIPMWVCAPTYRDAIVFYDNGHNIVSTLNVCLDCQYMEIKMFDHISGDYKTYELLKRFFIDIGHEVGES